MEFGRLVATCRRTAPDRHVNDIINRWRRRSTINTDAYIQAVCAQLGVTPDQPLDASSKPRYYAKGFVPPTFNMRTAVTASDQQISLPALARQWPLNFQPAQSAIPAMRHSTASRGPCDIPSPADQIRKQQQAEYRTNIDSRVRDSAAYMRGSCISPNAPYTRKTILPSLPTAYVKVTSVIPSSATRR